MIQYRCLMKKLQIYFLKIGIDIDGEEKAPRLDINFKVGEVVTVKGGSFDGQQGEISEIDHEHGKIKVMLEVLGRLTPVEVEHTEIEKIDY